MTEHTPPFILVDGSSYLFRAYHALPALTTSQGQPTGAIYGVINMLKRLLNDYQPTHIAVVFDPKGKTFRHDRYSDYKANRSAMPDELCQQIEPLFAVIQALGLPLIVEEGVEADDVIATLARQARQRGMPVLISTSDKDLAQIVTPAVTLINTMSNQLLDPAGVQEKFGVPPERIIDYLTLVGDTSDNLPGIPGVGPKTAVKWLTYYGSLDGVVQHAAEIKGKVGDNLRSHLKDIPLLRELVTVLTQVKLTITPIQLVRQGPQRERLRTLFASLEFKTWLAELLAAGTTRDRPAPRYETILTKTAFARWHRKLAAAKLFALDSETTSIDAMQAQLVGLSFAINANEAAYVPVAHDYLDAPAQLDKEWVLQQLQPLLQDKTKTIVGQNLKYDLQILHKEGIVLQTTLWDTLLESYVLNSTSTRHNLNSLALKYLGKGTIEFADIAGKGAKQLTFNHIPLAAAAPYAAEDADIALQLHHKLLPLIAQEKSVMRVLSEIEMPLMPVLARMEWRGVLVSAQLLEQHSAELQQRIAQLEQQAFDLAGHAFNLGSPKQLQTVLYQEQKLPIFKKTPGGQPSTAEAVLHDLAFDYALPQVILEFRSLSKLKSTYTDRLPVQINPTTGRVHTSYNQAVTSTGRLSSNNPNLQNIPIRSEEGRRIRQAFIAPSGYHIVAADYSQVELRIMAHISKDPALIKAFENQLDIHRATAAEVFDVPLAEVTSEQRRNAKAINFGLLYGMSAFGLARQLGIEHGLAQQYIDTYFKRYPKVNEYMETVRKVAAEQGYVETLFGRRLYVADINSSNAQRRRAAERAAINAPMQGTAAEIIKIAMINLDTWLQQHDQIDAYMVMQVHDELVFEVATADLAVVQDKVRQAMEQAAQLIVPLVVDVGVGCNWDEAH